MENKKNKKSLSEEKITRKEAIKKTGVAALTASSLLFLNTKHAAAQSPQDGDTHTSAYTASQQARPDRDR